MNNVAAITELDREIFAKLICSSNHPLKVMAKYAEGYNACANGWNNGVSDGGRIPYRSCSTAYFGYSAACSHILHRQLAEEKNIQVELITPEQLHQLAARALLA